MKGPWLEVSWYKVPWHRKIWRLFHCCFSMMGSAVFLGYILDDLTKIMSHFDGVFEEE